MINIYFIFSIIKLCNVFIIYIIDILIIKQYILTKMYIETYAFMKYKVG